MVLCGMMIQKGWSKWVRSPVIVSFNEKTTPVWAVPFPAVTICPENKSYSDLFNFTNAFLEIYHAGGPPYNLTNNEYVFMQ